MRENDKPTAEDAIRRAKQKKSAGKSYASRLSEVLSVILHPFAVPVYATAALLRYDPVMAALPSRIKSLYIIIIIIVAFAIPALCVFLLRTINVISKPAAEKPNDRKKRLIVTALSYGICIVMVANIMWGTIFYKLLAVGFFGSALALILSFSWRMSFYMIPMGAVTALLILFTAAGAATSPLPLAVTVLLSGILASARLYLGKHTLVQVAAGFALGFAVCAAVMLFIR